MHAVISLSLQSRKFWWYLTQTPSMLLHDVMMTSYCCQRYAECLVTTLCSSRTMHRHTTQRTCNSWTAASRTPNFLAPTCDLQTALTSILWITRSGLSCSIVSIADKSIVWMNRNGSPSMSDAVLLTQHSNFDEAIDQWRARHPVRRWACVHAKGGPTTCELTMLILSISVTFHVTCLTVASLITKSCQQRWPIHSC